jgi:ABC-type multidrug transport system fused ATPase/permease subunit
MFRRFLMPFMRLDEIVHPFHRTSLILLYTSTLSITSVLTSYFEPVISIFFSFLLTFPLTIGLTMFFLIILYQDWSKVTLFHIIMSPSILIILFLLLNALSNALSLPQRAAVYVHEQHVYDSLRRIGDSILHFDEFKKKDSCEKAERIKEEKKRKDKEAAEPGPKPFNAEDFKRAVDKLTEKEKKHWYDNEFFGYFARPTAGLIFAFKKFYALYGPGRFWSGVILALILAYYTWSIAKKLKKKEANPDSLTGE